MIDKTLTTEDLELISDIPKEGTIILPKIFDLIQENQQLHNFIKVLFKKDIFYDYLENPEGISKIIKRSIALGEIALESIETVTSLMLDKTLDTKNKNKEIKKEGESLLQYLIQFNYEEFNEIPILKVTSDKNGNLLIYNEKGEEVLFENLPLEIKTKIMELKA